MTQVVVVTNSELGWDCIVGVFGIDMLAEVEARFPKKPYHVDVHTVNSDLDDWE